MFVEKIRITLPRTLLRIELTPQEAYDFRMQASTTGIHDKIIGRIAAELANQEAIQAREVTIDG